MEVPEVLSRSRACWSRSAIRFSSSAERAGGQPGGGSMYSKPSGKPSSLAALAIVNLMGMGRGGPISEAPPSFTITQLDNPGQQHCTQGPQRQDRKTGPKHDRPSPVVDHVQRPNAPAQVLIRIDECVRIIA